MQHIVSNGTEQQKYMCGRLNNLLLVAYIDNGAHNGCCLKVRFSNLRAWCFCWHRSLTNCIGNEYVEVGLY